jgi:RNA polymerase sigma-70 factor (ECF subfamily)
MEPLPQAVASAAQFRTTRWSMVYRAGAKQCSAEEGRHALEELCRGYWGPLYAYVRRQSYSPEDAQDLTQEFFSRLLADHSFASVHESKGRFRSFLLASVKHLLANEWKRATRRFREVLSSPVTMQRRSARASDRAATQHLQETQRGDDGLEAKHSHARPKPDGPRYQRIR